MRDELGVTFLATQPGAGGGGVASARNGVGVRPPLIEGLWNPVFGTPSDPAGALESKRIRQEVRP